MGGVKIIVCAKQVPDPEAPSADYKLDFDRREIKFTDLRQVISPFDENALEAALRIKDENGADITVLSVGENIEDQVLRQALATGAENLILLKDQRFSDLESYSTAYVLATAIKKIGQYDLILAGRQAADTDSGQVGLILGEMLGIVCINLARSVRVENGKIVIEKIIPGGYEVLRTEMPALVTVSNEVGELRDFPLTKKLRSLRQPIEVWSADDCEIDLEKLIKRELLHLSAPLDMGKQCHYIEGNSPEEKGENLAKTLKELI